MKTLTAFLSVFCLTMYSVEAKQQMRPGLWKISFKIKTEKEIIEPAKQIQETLEKLSKKEQEQLKSTLLKQAGMDEEGKIRVCYSVEDFEHEEATISQMGESCLSRVVKSTPSKIVSNFACMNGFTGTNTWFIKNPLSYAGVTKIVSPQGEQSEIIYKGKFFSAICNEIEDVLI